MKNVKLLALVPAFVFAACSNGTTGAVSFSLTSRSAGAPAASPAFATAPSPTVAAAGDSTVIALGNDTVIVRSVELVLRQAQPNPTAVPARVPGPANAVLRGFRARGTPRALPPSRH